MKEFPDFMKNPLNRIKPEKQYTKDIEGYVFNGRDGSQMAFWTCYENRESTEHVHDYDEYFVVVAGRYDILIDDHHQSLEPGQECYIPKGSRHSGKALAGTRTIHCFGGKRTD